MSRSLKAGLAMAVACLAISPALADTVTNIPGGYVHTWTGNHGETFQVTRNNNTGQSVTKVDRHDGRGFVIFNTPPRPRVVKPYGGSLYDPETNRTTSVVVVPIPGPIAFPPMRGRMVMLVAAGNFWVVVAVLLVALSRELDVLAISMRPPIER